MNSKNSFQILEVAFCPLQCLKCIFNIKITNCCTAAAEVVWFACRCCHQKHACAQQPLRAPSKQTAVLSGSQGLGGWTQLLFSITKLAFILLQLAHTIRPVGASLACGASSLFAHCLLPAPISFSQFVACCPFMHFHFSAFFEDAFKRALMLS